MNSTLKLVLKAILVSISQLCGAALALLNDPESPEALNTALDKVKGLPKMFGDSQSAGTDDHGE